MISDSIILKQVPEVVNNQTVLNAGNINDIINILVENQAALMQAIKTVESIYVNAENNIDDKINEHINAISVKNIADVINDNLKSLNYAGLIDPKNNEVHNHYLPITGGTDSPEFNRVKSENGQPAISGAFISGKGNIAYEDNQVISGTFADTTTLDNNEHVLIAHGVGVGTDRRSNLYLYKSVEQNGKVRYVKVANHATAVDESSYGTSLPDSGETGQLFYLIQEE